MTEEYNYFRAEGESLRILRDIERRQERRAEIIREKLGELGVRDLKIQYEGPPHLVTTRSNALARGWFIDYDGGNMSGDAEVEATPRWPSADSTAVDKTIEAIWREDVDGPASLLLSFEMDSKVRTNLAIGYAEDSKEPGDISRAFVRTHTRKDRESFREGTLQDHVTGPTTDHGLVFGWHEIDSMKIGGDYYIRVPSAELWKRLRYGEEATPFTPPDAVPVSFDDMLNLDRQESLRLAALDQAKEMLGEATNSLPARVPAPEKDMPPVSAPPPKPRGLA